VFKKRKKNKKKSTFREYTEAIVVALLLAFFVRAFIVQAFKIPSGSMENSLLIGDHILVSKISYWFRSPERGDMLVFRFPLDEKRDFIKRVVGMPGEKIMIRDGKVYVNCNSLSYKTDCSPLEEPYVVFKPHGYPESHGKSWGPVTIPDDHLFVLGDNRNNSQDGRYWGLLKIGEFTNYMPVRLGTLKFSVPFPCSIWNAPCWDYKIRGVAFLVYWSWDGKAGSPRWNRIGKVLN
tara:strand:+ start:3361 stop:4065 length:705 start_codon:yes stop_codon:yes gene_type:complete